MAKITEEYEKTWRFETKQGHVGQEEPDPATDARAVPIYQTTSYVFRNSDHGEARFGLKDAGNIYGRLTNPTEGVFEARIASLENGTGALAVGSGAAAVTYAFQAVAHAGDHIVSAKNIYGGTYNYLKHTFPDYGVTTTFVDPFDLNEAEAAIQDNTKALYVESLGNPNGEVVDIEAWAALAHKHGLPLIVDNTFATPYLLRPIEHGADIVVHSATKFIGGHGTTLGGVIVDGNFDWTQSDKWPWLTEPNPSYHGVSFAKDTAPAAFVTYIRAILLRDTGATLSPFSAWLLLQGTETLSLRVERHVENALKVVDYLEKNPHVLSVSHPAVSKDPKQQELYKKYYPNGGGSIFTFDIDGDERKAKDFIDNLQLFSLLANVADVKSLAIHPASTTHSEDNAEELLEQGIRPNTIRLSIGIEHIDDIIADLEQSFAKTFND
ncbi:MAG: O-acetylhomoserine aminocarboxypropyltransferase/cysteine synthase [Eubacteriales bacterium]|jgi:O-acetylhomoserine (thiol)-lyase|nr:O-acetylhomoserine aminocarboxypropyltransferase/cysteine synthase [Lachnospiraceae bacterium]MDD5858804.1 O-acetylhomoserine aminocarboxypropyltransferase/cysteine synthase [Eubacteriales bacterium]MCH4063118.1 O-acetylhomoserine aminocarboxypropyltransferase/cysteine synthase [Lachnospiraceae bacterium]MCH4104426.1 O-acetylhomoserine aminocarboxypropyltransferase/cysteine synthase [Lachnospiraceae bacterium]MCI1308399.1 O-acetylhomoserine aminocarboxypropyltransferase/cysteine synthase [La